MDRINNFLKPGYILKKIWSNALGYKDMSSASQQFRTLFADEEKPADINADGEIDNKTFNRCLSQQNIASRFKEGDRIWQQ